MRRIAKRISLVALGLAGVLLALAAFAVFSNRSSAESALQKVKVGMTEAEVRHALVTLDYQGGKFNGGISHWTGTYHRQPRLWRGDNEWVQVDFTVDASKLWSLMGDDAPDQDAKLGVIFDAFRVSGVHIG